MNWLPIACPMCGWHLSMVLEPAEVFTEPMPCCGSRLSDPEAEKLAAQLRARRAA